MKLTTYLLLIAIVAYFVQGFDQPKCEHVFTQVEQACVKIDQPTWTGNVIYPECSIYTWPTGLQEGKELVCVKCFHVQKQVLDYGGNQQYKPFYYDLDSLNFRPIFKVDSIGGLTIDTTWRGTILGF